MKHHQLLTVSILFMACMLLDSCGAYLKTAYLQDMEPDVIYEASEKYTSKILRGDRINITVSSSQPALAAPFNPGIKLPDNDEIPVTGSTATIGNEGYLVDNEGNINFPVLGQIHIEGLSLDELSFYLQNIIVSQGYINEPIVKAQFVNFNVIVLGESGSQIISVPTGNMNMLELFARIGGISDLSDREHIRVIRTTGDRRQVYIVNSKTKDIYNSPVYYLQQNDIVYIPPLNYKLDAQTTNFIQILTLPMTIISAVASFVVMFVALL